MDKRGLEKIRKQLVERRRDLVREVLEKEHGGKGDDEVKDLGDLAFESYEKERLVGLGEHERRILTQINEALERVETTKYGLCLECDKKIPNGRLQAIPWVPYCLSCSEDIEKKGPPVS